MGGTARQLLTWDYGQVPLDSDEEDEGSEGDVEVQKHGRSNGCIIKEGTVWVFPLDWITNPNPSRHGLPRLWAPQGRIKAEVGTSALRDDINAAWVRVLAIGDLNPRARKVSVPVPVQGSVEE